ncbi:aromatic amino acid hydroxylase [Parapedobacter tibetensis]|uniref:aromatic amino acid hydroxylase n=1 Tax=Parapedobacter tibetensis TaxID=2972951 RepID=UPI00214DA714|nr:aromatic amino acid hydroxylase [Parapedobacter tibetensis]
MNTYNNPILDRLPLHLKQYIVEQHYERYTPVDQAVWRYVMRQNYSYLKDVAYYPYIPGLRAAGLSIERIPDLQTMNDNLKKIGWGAVTVDGFIPPVAFMEFQAYHVLVIAADIRQLEHIEYTPAPDIIHESSGHAPIIAEPDYAEYLSYFGEIGSKAMFSHKDFEQYEAIRKLSILKESHDATPGEIIAAEDRLKRIQANMGEPSEMALLSRLHWWTVEYGLIGTLDNPKIYGAGLLSSIGESASCMQPHVPKLPYSLETVNYTYDITKPQPHLFVTPTFEHLLDVLEQFADTMAFRVGGKTSINKAIECKNVCTAAYSSGLQVSGVFIEIEEGHDLHYLQTSGPTALAVGDKQLDGHGKSNHQEGFGSPVGHLDGQSKALEDFTDEELHGLGIQVDAPVTLRYVSGIEVHGTVIDIKRNHDKIMLISFSNCEVKDVQHGKLYFSPEWGIYDMAVGEGIVSVYCGAADKDAFEQVALVSNEYTHKAAYDDKTRLLHQYYALVRQIRESQKGFGELHSVWSALKTHHQDDWLCALEILEILKHHHYADGLATEIEHWLLDKSESQPELRKLIKDGFNLVENTEIDVLN